MSWLLLSCVVTEGSSSGPAPSTADRADALALCAAFEACALEGCSESERSARFRSTEVSSAWAVSLREELAAAELLDVPGRTLVQRIDQHEALEGPCVAVHAVWSRAP